MQANYFFALYTKILSQKLLLLLISYYIYNLTEASIFHLHIRNMQYQANIPELTNQLAALINQFLNFNSSKSEKKHEFKEIQAKLKAFSKSENFFQVAYELIMKKGEVTYEQLFITSLLLRDKFRYEFDKYSDQASISWLQTMLKQILKKYNVNPSDTFSNNICVCIICLYIKRAQQLKQMFKQNGLLQYIKSYIQGNSCPEYFYKFLEYLPEEVYSSKIVMDQTMKERVRAYVKSSQYAVLTHLNTVAPELWENKVIKKSHLFAALENWISIGYKQALFKELPNHFLVQKLFENCLDSSMSTQATDCLKIIIKKLKSSHKDETLFTFLGSGVFKLVESIKQHLKQFQDGSQINEALEVVANFGTLAVEFFIQNYNPDVKRFLESMIIFVQIEDIDVYPDLIDFWQCIINQIHKANAQNPQLQQIIKALYHGVCTKTRWTFQMISRMNDISQKNLGKFYNEAEAIMDRRQQSQDLFEVMALTLGKQNYINFVVKCIYDLPKQRSQVFWPCLQIYIFSLKNAVKDLHSVNEDIEKLVLSFGQIQEYVALKVAYLSLFRNLMTIKQRDALKKAEYIKTLFKVIAQSLSDQKLAEKAQKAFSKGCEENSEIVINYIQDFLQLLRKHQGNQQIVKGIMHVLNSNVETLQKYLPHVLTVLYQVFISSKSTIKRKSAYHSLYAVFKTLMRFQNKQHFKPTLVQFSKVIWPQVLKSLSQPKQIIDDEDPEIERVVKLVKFIMRCLRQDFIPFLESLFSTILQAYNKYPICSYIYMLEVSITVYYQNAHENDFFKSLYQKFCQVTYTHLKATQHIETYQLLIDDFIGMNKRFFIYNSRIVLQSGQLPYLIQMCIKLCNVVDVPQVSKSAYQFFQTMFMVYWSQDFIRKYNENQEGDKFEKNLENQSLYQQLKFFILPKLEVIIISMINHLEKVPLESTTQCILDALISEVKAFWEVNKEIWKPILQIIPQQILTNSEKQEIYECLPKVGSHDLEECRDSAMKVDRLLYIMNKRFVNNFKRRI